MIPVPQTAMVMAAGLGSRMRPLTDQTPKPLIDIAGKALLDRALDPLARAGVKRIVVNVHYLADQVEAHLAKRTGFDVTISDERGERLETGGALAKARPLLGDDPIFVVNTDAFWAPEDDSPLLQLAEYFDPADMDSVLLLADRERTLGFNGPGDFFLRDDSRVAWRGEAARSPYAFAGVRIIRPQIFDGEDVRAFSVLEKWRPLVDAGRLHGVAMDKFWLHVGDPTAKEDAEMWMRCHGA
ncbi:MAG: nucleotidyltransferase family protein [Pseudomonadota bacterium]